MRLPAERRNPSKPLARQRFVIVPEWILDADVSANAVRVWAVLRSYADNKTGECWPSRATVAKRCGQSVDTVDRAVKELVRVRALSVRRRKGKNGEPLTNLFRLVIHNDAAKKPLPRRKGAATGSRKGAERTKPIGTITPITNTTSSDSTPDYDIETLLRDAVARLTAPPSQPHRRHLA